MKLVKLAYAIAAFSVVFLCTINASGQKVKNYSISDSDIEFYLKQNNKESRLTEYKDDKTTLLLKLNQLAHINASRKKHRKQAVKLDILASRVANKIAKNAAEKGFMGHFNTKGETPYQRFAFAGGTDHVSENASALSSTEDLPSLTSDINGYMQQAHNAFMAEKAPNDGHKKNCIDPHHNYVGLGYYLHDGDFRYYEEFLDRYLEFGNFINMAKVNQTVKIPVKPIKGKYLHMILIYHEKFPKPMSISSINKKMKYDDYTNDLAFKILPWQLPTTSANGFTELEFNFSKKGLYYIQIYLDNKAYKSGSVSTKGKVQASGVVIQVR